MRNRLRVFKTIMKVTLTDGIPQETDVSKAQVVIEIEECMLLYNFTL